MMSNSAGEWYLTVLDANVIKGFDLFSKSDLYVQIKAGDKIFKTRACRNNDYPRWHETFSFPMNYMSDIEIKVLDDDIFRDDKIAVAYIQFKQFPTGSGEEKDYSIPLSYNNKDVGILHIRIKNNGGNMQMNYGNQPLYSGVQQQHQQPSYSGAQQQYQQPLSSNAQQQYHQPLSSSAQQQYQQPLSSNYDNANMNSGGYNTTMLGGHSYPHNNTDNNARIIHEEYREEHRTIPTIIRTSGQNQPNYDQNHSNNNYPPQNTTTVPTNTVPTTIIDSSKKHKKEHKHKNKGTKIALPEKHHHYVDGYTSSSSESSNDGEKRRAAEGKLGSHAYDQPIANGDPYLNNTMDPNRQPLNTYNNDVNHINH